MVFNTNIAPARLDWERRGSHKAPLSTLKGYLVLWELVLTPKLIKQRVSQSPPSQGDDPRLQTESETSPKTAGVCSLEDGCENVVFPLRVITWQGTKLTRLWLCADLPKQSSMFASVVRYGSCRNHRFVACTITTFSLSPSCFPAVGICGKWARKKAELPNG